MNPGFFTEAEVSSPRAALPLVAQCRRCGLDKTCASPKMPVAGRGRRKILVVGEAPGATEDQLGRPFVGRSGELLRSKLSGCGIDLDGDCWTTNSVICRPPGNELPERSVDFCRPNAVRAIRELRPEVILLLGAAAVRSVVGWLWKGDPGAVGRWVGFRIPSQEANAWVCPTWHPSAILRDERGSGVLEMLWAGHLAAACDLEGRPWPDGPPDYAARVRLLHDPDAAASAVHRLREGGRPVAFDFETDRLKPDHPDSRIACCAVSDGRETVAYPWAGRAVGATAELLESPVPKWGWNAKHEERWGLRLLGVAVRNWRWDGMLAAHLIDNRAGVTGLKFQAFARLGQPDYDSALKPYLAADGGGNAPNRVREAPPDKLLLYCGLDALLTWKIARVQRKELGLMD